jgi:hypothetical protein
MAAAVCQVSGREWIGIGDSLLDASKDVKTEESVKGASDREGQEDLLSFVSSEKRPPLRTLAAINASYSRRSARTFNILG